MGKNNTNSEVIHTVNKNDEVSPRTLNINITCLLHVCWCHRFLRTREVTSLGSTEHGTTPESRHVELPESLAAEVSQS